MKKPIAVALCGILGVSLVIGVFILPGCRKAAQATRATDGTSATAPVDSLKPALDRLRQATELAHYRDALFLLNSHLTSDTGKQVTPHAADVTEALHKSYRLDKDEAELVDAMLFRPIDAFHLQSCFLFRDAAHALQIDDNTPLEQARLGFAWVLRHVQLHEQSEEGLPAAFVLRRGFGSTLDRAIVFLALLRQFQIEGCVLAPAPDLAGPVLVGVLAESKPKPQLSLFDPRLGRPVMGLDQKAIATLEEARAHPELLKAFGWSAGAVAKLQAFQVNPLEALPARMRFLQELLALRDKVILYNDAGAVARELTKAAGRPAAVWNVQAAAQPAPTRALRQFLSVEEGGTDKRGRHYLFEAGRSTWPDVLLHLQGMGLLQLQDLRLVQQPDFPSQASEDLLSHARALFTIFAIEPRQYFLHGDYEAALKRVDRIRTVLEADEAANPLEGADLARQLKLWRERVEAAYIAKIVRKTPDGAARVAAIWEEDQYLRNVLHPDSEIPLTQYEKRLLSTILFTACRDRLGRQAGYLVAQCLHEKAAQLQANQDSRAAKGKDITIVKENAAYAWSNARGAWSDYLTRYGLNPRSLPMRLSAIQRRWNQREVQTALLLWEQLHQDMHATFDARLRLAEAQGHTLKSSPALKELLADLDRYRNSDLPKQLSACLDQARGSPVAPRLQLLMRDWGADGNLDALRQTIIARLPQKP